MRGLGAAEVLRLSGQDVSGYPRFTTGANLRIIVGQSFAAGAALARLFLSAARFALFSAIGPIDFSQRPARTVGPDSRCVNDGPTYDTFNGGDLDLYPIEEHFIEQTGVDTIRSEADVAAGAYDDNERGGVPETVCETLSWILRNLWVGNAPGAASPNAFTVTMNNAKSGASIAEIGSGDDLDRLTGAGGLIEVFAAAITAKGDSDPMQCDAVIWNHQEADEAANTADYPTPANDLADEIETKLASELGQSDMPPHLMLQVGGPKYGTNEIVVGSAAVDMMQDITGDSARFHLVGCKYEVPSYYFQDASIPGWPTAFINNGHPTLAGNVLMGLRYAIALHFIQDRQENYWPPFPDHCLLRGKNFLLVIPNKFPPLRVVDMVCGVEMQMLDSLGISFEDASGGKAEVEFARVVPGYDYLIEGRCFSDISGFTVCKTGRRDGPLTISGFTNIRDSFKLSMPIETPLLKLPFDQNQTVAAEGYVDSPLINLLGRYLEDIPGWVGQPDLGNPCARRAITAEPFP
jgi:hypothetical protein